MFTLLKRLSRFEIRADAKIERFLFHHHFLGFLIIFIGIPLVTLLAVCLFTAAVVLPISFFSGWL